MAQKIYFDESGYTGNDLLNENQDVFALDSVLAEETEAQDFIKSVRSRHKVQQSLIELKGSNLLRIRDGRFKASYGPAVVDEVFETFGDRIRACILEKPYAFAAKVFDHLIEPGITESDMALRAIDFHKFGAHLLHARFMDRPDMVSLFQKLLDGENVPKTELNVLINNSGSEQVRALLSILEARYDDILSGMHALMESPVGKWKLELSFTSLITLLRSWEGLGCRLDIVADDSKPLIEQRTLFESRSASVTFCPSRSSAGIQIADIAAGALIYAWTRHDETARRWKMFIPKIAGEGSVIPDFEESYIRPGSVECDRNLAILTKLHEQCIGGEVVGRGVADLLAYYDRHSRAL